ncbi:MAG: flagellar biosynthesis protein FlhF [Eubacterium sp.]|nr:flagellar biosynthesis protein FlhF [Eubacterium sp.]MCI9410448.1 flagellar biosynthesis protein FlhF [Eubacterium sp.]
MIIKKFLAATETEAIEMAKRELGSNAIVMNIKKVRPRGFAKFFIKSKVEVTAALDENVVYDTDNKNPASDEKRDGVALELTAPKFVPDIVAVEGEDKNVATIEEKLDSLQKMLEKQMSDKMQEEKTYPAEEEMDREPSRKEIQAEKRSKEISKAKACKELIRKQMIQNEVEESIAEMLIDEVDRSLPKDAALDQILAAIYQKIILMTGQPYVLDKEVEEGETKYVFFLGSTGVGKTTTIAKIASRMKLNHKKNIALVTADTFRIAAVEQLKTYANILNVPIKVVYSPEELGEMREELDQFDICFIDTAGCSHKNREQMENIKNLIEQIPISRREVYLVLNAGAKYNDLKDIADVYSDLTDFSLIFTKLDETSSAGVMLNMRTYTDRPLSYVTWGQNVPDDIGKVDAQKIAKKLLGGKS